MPARSGGYSVSAHSDNVGAASGKRLSDGSESGFGGIVLLTEMRENFIWFILCRAFPPVDRIYLWYFPLFAMESARYICSSSITRMS